MTLLEGRALAAEIRERAATGAAAGRPPVLAAVIATDDPATDWYIGSIAKAATATGIEVREERLGNDDVAGVLARLETVSADPAVDAIICLTPLPPGSRCPRPVSGSLRPRTSTARARSASDAWRRDWRPTRRRPPRR